MNVKIYYKSGKKELVHNLRVYPDLFLAIITNPARGDVNYLRSVELKKSPISSIKTRMFRDTPFGFVSLREAVLLPREAEFKIVVHPLLLEPFPDELSVIKDTVFLRRKVDRREFFYECRLKEVDVLDIPVIEEYAREVDGEKEGFVLKNISKE